MLQNHVQSTLRRQIEHQRQGTPANANKRHDIRMSKWHKNIEFLSGSTISLACVLYGVPVPLALGGLVGDQSGLLGFGAGMDGLQHFHGDVDDGVAAAALARALEDEAEGAATKQVAFLDVFGFDEVTLAQIHKCLKSNRKHTF